MSSGHIKFLRHTPNVGLFQQGIKDKRQIEPVDNVLVHLLEKHNQINSVGSWAKGKVNETIQVSRDSMNSQKQPALYLSSSIFLVLRQ